MSISRPFSYNPTQQTQGVSEQFGSLSVGSIGGTYGNSPGGIKWYNGPDESLGYVIATSLPSGGIPSPDGTIGNVSFWRTNEFSNNEFISLSNQISGQNFTTINQAITWLNSNGYWTSLSIDLGSIYLGGDFTVFSGYPLSMIGVLNTDASIDSTFNIGIGFNGGTPNNITNQSDGKMLIGGSFTSYSTTSRRRLIRLNSDGSIDNSFNIGGGFNGTVNSTYLQSNGKIVVGGSFTTYSSVTKNSIVRLNSDGSIDSTFNIGTGFNSTIFPVIVQSDGKIITGGDFTTYSGISKNRILRLNSNGTIDSTFNIGTGFSSTVLSISIQSDGKILVGGDFTSYSGVSSNRIIRLNSDGSVDSTFNTGTGFNATVNSTYIQSDGKILVGGTFTSYSGVSSNRIIRLNSDGSVDSTFVFNSRFDNAVNSIYLQSDGKILVGGSFTSYSGVSSNRIIRLNSNGSIDLTFNSGTGFGNVVTAVSSNSVGKVIAVGSFTIYLGVLKNKILCLNSDGTIKSSFNIGSGFSSTVNSTYLQSDGKILAGGIFISYNSITSNRFIRLNSNGTIDSTFNIGTGFNSTVNTISVQSDGKILVGGAFTSYSGVSLNRFIRLNTDGTIDSTFNIGTGFNNTVNTISVQSDGKILVGGLFILYSGISENRIVRLNTDGTIDSTFNTGTGFNSGVNTISVQSDGKIIVGGEFTSYSGASSLYIIRLNSNSSIDPTFNDIYKFNNIVTTTKIQSDGKIIVGGSFTSYSRTPKNGIIRLNSDSTIDTTFNVGGGINNSVLTMSNSN